MTAVSRAGFIAVLAGASALLVYAAVQGRNALRIATGSVSYSLCAAAFVSDLDPDQVYVEEQLHLGPMALIDWALRYRIDRARREVVTTIAGNFAARAAFRDGLGCVLVHGNDAVPEPDGLKVASTHESPEPGLVEPADPALREALALAFAEPDPAHPRLTKAVAVMHAGRLIAERYAQGITPETPLHTHSISKSVTSALIGILVQRGALQAQQPAPVAAWQGSEDPRRAVTVDQLLRMTSGLPFDETGGVLNPANRMWFLERDMAGFAQRMPLAHAPGSEWGYSNLGYMILSRLVRDAAGGRCAQTEQFIRRELFEPLGMHSSVIECDADGTPLGPSHVYASARDLLRFGQLYLDDGIASGRRILPEGWVRYSASQTLRTGYGAGFWTNLVNEGAVPIWDAPWGMPQLPKDMFYARGYLGQYVIIIPSENLVVVRLGITHDGSTGIATATERIIAALRNDQRRQAVTGARAIASSYRSNQ